MDERINTVFIIPKILVDKKVPQNIGKYALNYLIEQIMNICSVQVNEICTCNNKHTLKLPCAHELLNNLTLESIIIPKEYLQLEKDILITTKNTQTPCVFETIEKTEAELNLRESVEKLYSMEGTLQKRNELAREIERYISREEYKWKKAQHLDKVFYKL